jgi:hypothetical protein
MSEYMAQLLQEPDPRDVQIAQLSERNRVLVGALTNLLHYANCAGIYLDERVTHRNGRLDADASSSNIEHNIQVQQAIAHAEAALRSCGGE